MSYCRVIFHALLLLLITPGLAIHARAEMYAPVESFEAEMDAYAQMQSGLPITYDGFLKLLHDLENDELEKRYNLDDLDQINQFLISCARKGLLPSDDEAELEADIEELLSHSDCSRFSFWTDGNYSVAPAVLFGSVQAVLCRNVFKTAWKDTKKWVRKHKKPIIIVAAATAAAALTLGIAAAITTTAAAGAASAAGGSSDHKDKNKEAKDTKPIPFPSSSVTNEPSLIGSTFENELLSFKELIDREEFLNSKNTRFSLEEDGRILRDAFAYQSLDVFQKQAASNPQFHRELQELGQSIHPRPSETIFSMNGFTYPVPKPSKGFDGNVYQLFDGNLYQMRGEHALERHSYDQAILDFSKVIEENPSHPDAYLERAYAHLYTGNYQDALKDHEVHLSQKPAPSAELTSFSKAFARGLTKGAKESGEGLVSFAGDALVHPIDTAREMWDGCAALAELFLDK